ncbi:MAG: hypothetical protein Q7J42_03000 [Sulfuritalea sp.]|nr:hypothetical protein [Sulfuritalea sp.]
MVWRKGFLFSVLFFLAQASAADETFSRWKGKEMIDRAYAVQDAARAYVKEMELEGSRGRSALDRMIGDGFMCGFTIVRKDDPPLIFCTKSKPAIHDCAVLDVYLFFAWKGNERKFEKLVAELENTMVNGIEPVCKLPVRKEAGP